jgi:hypothetical protein
MQKIILLIGLLFLGSLVKAQTFYDINTIQKIEIQFSQMEWDYQLDTAKSGADGFLVAQVKVNGTEYDSVGVKYKGNSSYNAAAIKNPLHIALDEYKSQNYLGYKDIKLSNCYADPSMIREVLSYSILKNYMDCPLSNFAQVYINGVYLGLYSNDESINKTFCAKHFSSSKNTLIKANPVLNPGPASKCNLKYIAEDSSAYFNFYEIKSDYGWNDLVTLCNTVTNNPSEIESAMDMDRVAWMLAFNNVLVNLDSYTGVFTQNYYLYKDNNKRFNPIIWDLNMSLGGFPYIGSSNTIMGSLTVADMELLSPTIHAADQYWPLINDVMNNASLRKIYFAHMRTITNEIFANNSYVSTASQLQAIVDTAVKSDLNKAFTYQQFQNGMSGNCTFGSYVVPGITTLMTARVQFLQSNTEYSYTAPSITSVTSSSPSPVINSNVTITAQVSNANAGAVFLGYRTNKLAKFTKIAMYDDGAHNDGAANDDVFGTSFTMLTTQAQYYIYAENNNAAMFSPERAEHEYYTLPNTTTSLQEIITDNMKLYPNPANNILNILTGSDTYQTLNIYNMQGVNVYQNKFYQNITIDVSNWSAGIYLADIDGKIKKRIVVIH